MATNVQINVGANTTSAERAVEALFKKDYNLNVNIKGGQPLGRITGDLSEFNKSMDAANARVIAFGASASVVYGIQKAFHALVDSTIEVQKALNEVQVVLNASDRDIAKFGASLFNVAKQTGQSFQEVATAATEFSRQGLGMEETLKRTSDALILSRLSGMGAAQSVQALTAAINSFSSQAITASDVVNKFANVDTAFAVSSKDLAEGVSRVGSSAAQAGISLDQLIGLVTAAQVATARGGAVIGNSFKTIFARLDRTKTQDLLESLGISTTDASGKIRGTIDLLQDLAKVYDTLARPQQAQVAEKVGGVFQINILKATLADLSKEYSVYKQAVDISSTSTDEAIQRNQALNQTYSAQINALKQNAMQLSATAGEKLIGPSLSRLVGGGNSVLGEINEADANSYGSKLASGILSGLGQFLAGPGLALIGGVLIKLFADFTKYIGTGAKELLGLNTAAKEQAGLQKSIAEILSKDPSIYKQIEAGAMSVSEVTRSVLANLKLQTTELELQAKLSKEIATIAYTGGARVVGSVARTTTKAAGYIPNFASDEDMEEMHARMLGARNPRAKEGRGTIGGKRFLMNSEEDEIPNFGSNGDSAVIPRYAKGYIPNFAGYTVEEIASFNPRVKNKLLKNDGRLNAQDKINVGGFKEEKVQLKPNESPDQYEERVLGMEKFGFTDNSGLFGKRTSAIDGYKQVGNTLTISEVKSGFYRPEEIITKFARAFPENYDRSPFSSFFTEGLDNIKINGILISPSLVGGNNKEYTKEELEQVKNEQVQQDISKRRKRILRKGLAGGYVPNFAKAREFTHEIGGQLFKTNAPSASNLIKQLSNAESGDLYRGMGSNIPISENAINAARGLLSPAIDLGNQYKVGLIHSVLNSPLTWNKVAFADKKNGKRYEVGVESAGPHSDVVRGQEAHAENIVEQGLIKSTNEYIDALGGSKLPKINNIDQFANAGAVKAAVGTAFETAIERSTREGMGGGDNGGQGRRIDFGSPSGALRKLFGGISSQTLEAKYSPDLVREVPIKAFEEGKFNDLIATKSAGATGAKTKGKASGYIPNFADRVGIVTGDVIRGNEYKAVIEYLANTSKPISTILGPAGVGKTTRASNMGGQLLRSFAEMNRFDKFILDRAGFDLPQKDTITAENIRKIFAKSNASGGLDVLFGSRNTVASLRERRLQEGDQIIGERNNLKSGSSGVGSFTKGIRGFLGEYENANVLRMRKSGNEYGLSKVNFASGYIPNFVDAIHESIAREIGAGAPKSGIYVKQYSDLANSDNPMGLGVFNSRDEGSPSKEKGAIRRKGYAAGYIPNFAEDTSGGDVTTSVAAVGTELTSVLTMLMFANSGLKGAFNTELEARRKASAELIAQNEKELADKISQRTSLASEERNFTKNIMAAKNAVQQEEITERYLNIAQLKAANQREISEIQNVSSSLQQAAAKLQNPSLGTKASVGMAAYGSQVGFAVSMLAPIISETIVGGINQTTKEGRTSAAAVRGASDIASYTAMGGSVGGAPGAGIGALIGVVSAGVGYLKEMSTDMPELIAAQKKASQEKSNLMNEQGVIMPLLEKIQNVRENAGGVAGTKPEMDIRKQVDEATKSDPALRAKIVESKYNFDNVKEIFIKEATILTEKEKQAEKAKVIGASAEAIGGSMWEKSTNYLDPRKMGENFSKGNYVQAGLSAVLGVVPAVSNMALGGDENRTEREVKTGQLIGTEMLKSDKLDSIANISVELKNLKNVKDFSGLANASMGAIDINSAKKLEESGASLSKIVEGISIQLLQHSNVLQQTVAKAESFENQFGPMVNMMRYNKDLLSKSLQELSKAIQIGAEGLKFGEQFRQNRSSARAETLNEMGYTGTSERMRIENAYDSTVKGTEVANQADILSTVARGIFPQIMNPVGNVPASYSEKPEERLAQMKEQMLAAGQGGADMMNTVREMLATKDKTVQSGAGAVKIYDVEKAMQIFSKNPAVAAGGGTTEGAKTIADVKESIMAANDKLISAQRELAVKAAEQIDKLISVTIQRLDKVGGGIENIFSDKGNPIARGAVDASDAYTRVVSEKKSTEFEKGREALNLGTNINKMMGGIPVFDKNSIITKQAEAGSAFGLRKQFDELFLSLSKSAGGKEASANMKEEFIKSTGAQQVGGLNKQGQFDEAIKRATELQTAKALGFRDTEYNTKAGQAQYAQTVNAVKERIGGVSGGKELVGAYENASKISTDPAAQATYVLTQITEKSIGKTNSLLEEIKNQKTTFEKPTGPAFLANAFDKQPSAVDFDKPVVDGGGIFKGGPASVYNNVTMNPNEERWSQSPMNPYVQSQRKLSEMPGAPIKENAAKLTISPIKVDGAVTVNTVGNNIDKVIPKDIQATLQTALQAQMPMLVSKILTDLLTPISEKVRNLEWKDSHDGQNKPPSDQKPINERPLSPSV